VNKLLENAFVTETTVSQADKQEQNCLGC